MVFVSPHPSPGGIKIFVGMNCCSCAAGDVAEGDGDATADALGELLALGDSLRDTVGCGVMLGVDEGDRGTPCAAVGSNAITY